MKVVTRLALAVLAIGAGILFAAIGVGLTIGMVYGPNAPTRAASVATLPTIPAATAAAAPIEEDDPGWDCATMGNRQCGVGAAPLSLYCQTEPSATDLGVEIIAYPAGMVVTRAGLPVPCS